MLIDSPYSIVSGIFLNVKIFELTKYLSGIFHHISKCIFFKFTFITNFAKGTVKDLNSTISLWEKEI